MDGLTLALVMLLIGTGIMLIVAEAFVCTSGVLAIAGVVTILAGIGVPFYFGDTTAGVVTLAIVVGLSILLPWTFNALNLWEYGLVRPLTPSGPEDDATVAAMPVIAELEQLRGRYGRATSDLRPCGVADFDGKRIDVLTEGMMVEAGAWVRCIDVKAGKVFVRPAEQPRLSDLENMDLT